MLLLAAVRRVFCARWWLVVGVGWLESLAALEDADGLL